MSDFKWFERECLHDIGWYLRNDGDPGPFVARRRMLLSEGINSMTGARNFGDGTTYWFEPVVILFHGPIKDGFRFSYPSSDKRMLGLRDEWGQFVELAEMFPKPAIWHFLGAREYRGRRAAVNVEPICLVNTPNLTGDVRGIYSLYKHMSNRKLPSFVPDQYPTEAMGLNERFNERISRD